MMHCPTCGKDFKLVKAGDQLVCHNCGYTETNLELSLVTRSFSSDFLKQIGSVLINGNFGDFVSNLEIIEILRYFRQCNPTIDIEISTNASARGKRFWQDLGELGNITVGFCLDGIDEDTHQLYRQDTSWSKQSQQGLICTTVGLLLSSRGGCLALSCRAV